MEDIRHIVLDEMGEYFTIQGFNKELALRLDAGAEELKDTHKFLERHCHKPDPAKRKSWRKGTSPEAIANRPELNVENCVAYLRERGYKIMRYVEVV